MWYQGDGALTTGCIYRSQHSWRTIDLRVEKAVQAWQGGYIRGDLSTLDMRFCEYYQDRLHVYPQFTYLSFELGLSAYEKGFESRLGVAVGSYLGKGGWQQSRRGCEDDPF